MPQVDKIYVEVTADLRQTDRSMKAVENRVDVAANRMARSVDRASTTIANAPNRMASGRRGSLDRLIMGTPNRMIGAFIGVGAVGGAFRGIADSISQADSSWQNIAFNTSKHLPILRDILGMYEAIYAKQYDIADLTGAMSRMDAMAANRRGAEMGIAELEREARLRSARTPEERDRVEAQLEIEALHEKRRQIQEMIDAGNSMPEVKKERTDRLNSAIGALINAVNADLIAGRQKPQVFGMDSFGTMLGTFKARWNQVEGEKGTGDLTAADIKKTASNTGQMVSLLERAPVIRVFS